MKSDLRGFLGRWAAKGFADSYARTAIRVVENLQKTAEAYARESYSGGADRFGEEHTILELRDFLIARGIGQEEAFAQLDGLMCADVHIDPSVQEIDS